MRTSALFGATSFGFFEIFCVSARIRRGEPVRTRGLQGKGVIFFRFCTDIFSGRPLILVIYIYKFVTSDLNFRVFQACYWALKQIRVWAYSFEFEPNSWPVYNSERRVLIADKVTNINIKNKTNFIV